MVDLEAERSYVESLRQEWLAERDRLRKTLADRTTPGANYWEAEHRAEQRFLMAAKVMSVLEGVV